jgi:peroxiredoxin family protein
MKKAVLFLCLTMCFFSCSNENVTQPEDQACDNGTFVGQVILKNQQEVDDFGAMCYSKIDGSLVIGNIFGATDDIVDLSPLSNMNQVFASNSNDNPGWLRIKANNLTSLNGLQNITSVNGLMIYNCNKLVDLSGLDALENIGGNPNDFQTLDIHSNAELVNLEGLNKLSSIGLSGYISYIRFGDNPKLLNLDALSALNEINSEFYFETVLDHSTEDIRGNDVLSDFCGVQGLFNSGNFSPENIFISHNAYNPTVQDIIDGYCSQ